MERTPVDLTVDDAASALMLSTWAVLRYIREDKVRREHGEGPLIFPNAYLLHNSRKHGYRVPECDVLNYAEQQGGWLVQQAQIIIEQARSEQQQAFNQMLDERQARKRDHLSPKTPALVQA